MDEIFKLLKKFDIKGLLLAPTHNKYLQFFRCMLAGGIATVADWFSLILLTEIGMFYITSAVFAYAVGFVVNYLLSKFFVFNGSNARTGLVLEFLGYLIIGAVGMGLTVGIMYILTSLAHFHYFSSKLIATTIVFFWNYVARKKFLYEN